VSDDWLKTNREMWDERVPIHVASDFYDVERFVAGASTLRPFELEELGDLSGRTLVHPQCHFGLDTLSLARAGARVTGMDFSEPAVAAARKLAAWLPDIEAWASTMAALLSPGATFYLAEFHPFTDVFADEGLTVAHPYFHDDPLVWDEPGTYADLEAKTMHNRSIEWSHGLGSVVSALIDAGLRIELLHEHDYTLFPRWPMLRREADGTYRFPDATPSLPLMYSLRATGP
jgi:SAM-dependent methyltransferase